MANEHILYISLKHHKICIGSLVDGSLHVSGEKDCYQLESTCCWEQRTLLSGLLFVVLNSLSMRPLNFRRKICMYYSYWNAYIWILRNETQDRDEKVWSLLVSNRTWHFNFLSNFILFQQNIFCSPKSFSAVDWGGLEVNINFVTIECSKPQLRQSSWQQVRVVQLPPFVLFGDLFYAKTVYSKFNFH